MKTETKTKLLNLIPTLIARFRTEFETSARKEYYPATQDLVNQIESRFSFLNLQESDLQFDVDIIKKQELESSLTQSFGNGVKSAFMGIEGKETAAQVDRTRETNKEYFYRVMDMIQNAQVEVKDLIDSLPTTDTIDELQIKYAELQNIYEAIENKGAVAAAIDEMLDQVQMAATSLRGMSVPTTEINAIIYG